MTFSDQIKERKVILTGSCEILASDISSIVDAFETRIMELESDLDNAREDLELEKALTVKLKGLLDGGLVELVGELVKHIEDAECCHCQGGYESVETGCTIHCISGVLLTKAKEAMP